jgi:SAM-dependent methyltransferase
MRVAAGDTDYESSGQGYERHRRPDPRIGAMIHQHLGAGRSVVNVGAGAGSYEPADRCVLAVEPSGAMRARRSLTEAVPAINAAAEALPFDDASIDAAMAIFTVHQWADPARGLAELRRVTRGPVVVMTLDVETPSGFWLGEYLPERLAAEQNRFPPLTAIRTALGGRTEVIPVPIPLDCTDGFLEAFYGRPEALLDPPSAPPSRGGSSSPTPWPAPGCAASLTTLPTAAGTPATDTSATNRATPARSSSSPPNPDGAPLVAVSDPHPGTGGLREVGSDQAPHHRVATATALRDVVSKGSFSGKPGQLRDSLGGGVGRPAG